MNKKLFSTVSPSRVAPVANAINHAGASAYDKESRNKLITLAGTVSFADGFYATGDYQVKQFTDTIAMVDDLYLAQCTVYAHEQMKMKDSVAVMLSALSVRNPTLFKVVFARIVDFKLVRNLVTVSRSGLVGRRCLGSAPRKTIRNWIQGLTPRQMMSFSIGNEPSLKDIVYLVHPNFSGTDLEHDVRRYIGREADETRFSVPMKEFIALKDGGAITKNVPLEMALGIPDISSRMPELVDIMTWNQIRQRLNMIFRNCTDSKIKTLVTQKICAKLKDSKTIVDSKALPHSILATLTYATDVPSEVFNSIQDALDHATENVSSFTGKKVLVAADRSPSMNTPATGYRGSATSKMMAKNIADLFAAVIAKKNSATLLQFDTRYEKISYNSRDSVSTIYNILKSRSGGGTDCSSVLDYALQDPMAHDVVIILSDDQSWVGNQFHTATPLAQKWTRYKRINKNAKLILVDLIASGTTQAPESPDTLCIGGWSDSIYTVAHDFVMAGKMDGKINLVSEVEKIDVTPVNSQIVVSDTD